MTKKSKILLVTLFLNVCVFIYLTMHHYSVKTGIGSSSICSISSKLNCDAAALSSYSEVLHIPVAVLGAVFHLVQFFFVFFFSLGWAESSAYQKNTIRAQLAVSALVSVVMAAISLIFVKVACPFCMVTYVLSLVNLALGWNLVNPSSKDPFDVSGYFGEYKSHLYALIAIPAISWLVAGMFSNHYKLDEMRKYVPEKLAIWRASTENSFDLNLGISNKVMNPKFTLVEYADFKCPHCRDASKSIGLFLNSHPDILFIFKPFPLDGTCNTAINHKGDGSRCAFAAIALCSDKLASKGLEVTHWLFENQEKFYPVTDAKTLYPEIQEKFGIDTKALGECSDSAETYDLLKKSGEEGERAGVEGTPTIYLNGKKLPWGHVPEVLNQAVQ
jgi:protein-disulfide isomerase/uncharacterized membrane protein